MSQVSIPLFLQTLGNSKNKLFRGGRLKIKENILTTERNFIQISNIAQVSCGTRPKNMFHAGASTFLLLTGILTGIIGLLLSSPAVVFVGLMISAGGCLVTTLINPESVYVMQIVLNHGGSYSFTTSDQEFLKTAYTTLMGYIDSREEKSRNVTFNFGNSTLIYDQESENVES